MAEILIRQVRSGNGASPRQRAALRSLRLGRIGRATTRDDGPELRGMVRVVEHLVQVEDGAKGSGARGDP